MFKLQSSNLKPQTSNHLSLAELEVSTGLRLTWLLALNLTAVACQESVVLQALLVFSVDLDQCTSDGETQSLALACEAATIEVGLDVILPLYTKQLQRLLNHVLQDS